MEKDNFEQFVIPGREVLLSEKVAQQIRELIRERDLKAGDRLPSEFELAETLRVGRGTIREAVKILVTRSCLEIRRGKGTFVTEKSGAASDPLGFDYVTDQVKLAEELCELRLHLEPWIASLAAERITQEEKEELQHRCEQVEDAILAGWEHAAFDMAFHQYIAQCTHNSVLPELMPIITYSVNLFSHLKEPGMLMATIRGHRSVADAICANDAYAARESMKAHIATNLESIRRIQAYAAGQKESKQTD